MTMRCQHDKGFLKDSKKENTASVISWNKHLQKVQENAAVPFSCSLSVEVCQKHK